MLKVNIHITGVEESKATLDRIKRASQDMEPDLQYVGEWLLDFLSNDVFESYGAILGTPWAPLRASTIRQRLKGYSHVGAENLLYRTGALRRGWKLRTSKDYALVRIEGSAEAYAPYHQYGTSRMPQRVLIRFTSKITNEIERRFKQHFTERVRRAM